MNKPSMITFGIADDDVLFRKALVPALCTTSDIKVSFCSSDGYELLTSFYKQPPQVLIIDLYMPVISGIEAIKAIRETGEEVKIIGISSFFQDDVRLQLKKEYVEGYCARNIGDIKVAFSKILKGDTFFKEEYFDLWRKGDYEIKKKSDHPLFSLKSVDIEILKLCCEGSSNKDIALHLNLSSRTVDAYVGRLIHKFKLKSKQELVKFAYDNGFCRLHCENNSLGMCHLSSIFV